MKKQSLLYTLLMLLLGGCQAPRQIDLNPALVFHVGGTLYNPKIYPEFSRNDKYLGVRTDEELRSERERYMKHLSPTIKSVDRQSTVNGRVRDSYRTETRIESK